MSVFRIYTLKLTTCTICLYVMCKKKNLNGQCNLMKTGSVAFSQQVHSSGYGCEFPYLVAILTKKKFFTISYSRLKRSGNKKQWVSTKFLWILY